MEIYVYSDESGVFDKTHNEVFVFGGLIFLKKRDMETCSRKYIAAENTIRNGKYGTDDELKACRISNKEKGKLYRSLNHQVGIYDNKPAYTAAGQSLNAVGSDAADTEDQNCGICKALKALASGDEFGSGKFMGHKGGVLA